MNPHWTAAKFLKQFCAQVFVIDSWSSPVKHLTLVQVPLVEYDRITMHSSSLGASVLAASLHDMLKCHRSFLGEICATQTHCGTCLWHSNHDQNGTWPRRNTPSQPFHTYTHRHEYQKYTVLYLIKKLRTVLRSTCVLSKSLPICLVQTRA